MNVHVRYTMEGCVLKGTRESVKYGERQREIGRERKKLREREREGKTGRNRERARSREKERIERQAGTSVYLGAGVFRGVCVC